MLPVQTNSTFTLIHVLGAAFGFIVEAADGARKRDGFRYTERMTRARRFRSPLLLLVLALSGCEWLLPNVPDAPDPPPPVTYPVTIEFEDTSDENHFFHPHATVTAAAWTAPPQCPSESGPAFCEPDHPLPPLMLDLFNDGNVTLTRVFGEVEVWSRAGEQVVVLPWLKETFRARGDEINAWEPRETVRVELDARALCRDGSVPVCAPATFTAGAVGRLYVRLEAVEVLPAGVK